MAILKKVDKLHEAVAWEGDIPIRSRYTAGVAGERFFREIKDNGRFMGTHCEVCDLLYVPAVMYCEPCFSELSEWIEVPSQGTVFTYTVLYRDLENRLLDPPAVLAYVKLYGTDGGLVHYLGDVDPEEVEIGMEVEAVFKDPAERQGTILDVVYFRPVQG
ncbi:MAG TPA: Zn-ribbon domain-containing OB-fold protein [Anaerolineae bacterium]|nr:Zn-ribbon domain-containing OB-fold protein [Anaerolineae bacterium]